jgi:hypothetical protein
MLGYQKSVPGHAACSAVQSIKVSESEPKPKTTTKNKTYPNPEFEIT